MRSRSQGAGTIVDNSLVLYLDAANQRSYPGNGTAWSDLSGNSNHFTLVNTPTYTGKAIRFDGVTQYAQCINTTFGNFGSGSFTVETIFNVSTVQQYGPTLMKKASLTNNTVATGYPGWGYDPYAGLFRIAPDGGVGFDISTAVTANQQNTHTVHVITRSSNEITGSNYVNGTLVSTVTKATFGGNNSVDNSLYARIAYNSGETDYRSGDIYLVRAYNRALSTTEIAQNYTALRARFNI